MTRERLLAFIGASLLRLLFSTLRFKIDDPVGFSDIPADKPVIMCFWHNRILGISVTFLRKYPHRTRQGVTVLTSPSKDGEILAGVVKGLGMGAVRGSSSRRGAEAVLKLIDLIKSGGDIAITPDGPRGPRYRLGPGAITLAQVTGAPIIPLHAKFSWCLRLKTWDGFIIPLPFSKVSATVGLPISVPRELTKEQFEETRLRVETLLKNEAD